jgi:hypothetical protein
VQARQTQHRQQSRGGRDDLNPQVASYQDFFSTQPPFFSKAEEPLDADTWLHTIESKFALLLYLVRTRVKLTLPPSNFMVVTIRMTDGVMYNIMEGNDTPSVLLNFDKVAVCGDRG